MINDEENTYSKIDVEWNEHTPEGELVFKKGKSLLRYSQMSAGEKTMIALVADLARQITIANPNATKPLEVGTGVVLIDEIDLHLHPKWQSRVVVILRELFPNIQFVITTHSPLILNHIPSKYIRSIENGNIYGVIETYGQEVGTVLENIMQLDESSKYRQEFEKIYDLMRLNKISEAKNMVDDLAIKIEGKHPEVLKLHNLLRKKELLKR